MTVPNQDTPNQQYIDDIREVMGEALDLFKRLNRLSIEEIQRAKQQSDAIDLARVYYHLRVVLESVLDQHDIGIKKTFDRLARNDFPDMLEDRGIDSVPLSDVGKRISPSVRTYCKMINRDACVEYLQNHKVIDNETGEISKPYAHIPQFTVNANTLGSTAKELAKAGKQLPEHLTDADGKKVLDENGVPLSMFETGHLNNTTWRVLPKKKG